MSPRLSGALWLLCITPVLLLQLHAWAILPLAWSVRDVAPAGDPIGLAHLAPLGTTWMSRESTGDSPARLLEDGRLLGPANAASTDVVKLGSGRFTIEGGVLVFSTPDASSPVANGRRYTLEWPVPPPTWIRSLAIALAVVATLFAAARHRRGIGGFLAAPPLWAPLVSFVSVAVVTRLWFFTDFPVPSVVGDSKSYFDVVMDMDAGRWPELGIRPPGYPLFMKLVFSVKNSIFALLVAQNLLTLVTGLTVICAFHRYRPWLAWWAAMAMMVFMSGIWSFDSDTAMLSDGVYANAIILSLAALTMGISGRRTAALALTSVMMGVAILVRPAGMFLLVIYLLVLLFLIRNRFTGVQIATFAAPLPVLLLVLCVYNARTIGLFGLSEFGENNLAFATMTFWEQDERYSPELNDAISRAQAVMGTRLTDEERRLLRESWDFSRLAPVFLKGFTWSALDPALDAGGGTYRTARGWLRQVSLGSIRQHPDIYAKFVLTQLWLQYVNNVQYQDDFLNGIRNRVVDVYLTGRFIPGEGQANDIAIAKEYAPPPPLPLVAIGGSAAEPHITLQQTSASRRLYRHVYDLRREYFASVYWVWVCGAAFVVAAVALVRSGGRNPGAFLSCVFALSVLGAGMVVALVEYGGHRYSYVMEFAYYLPLLPLPFVWPVEWSSRSAS